MMHKKDALNAGRSPLSAMEQLHYTNSDFNVYNVNERLFGKHGITVSRDAGTGSGCGLQRIAPSDYSASCLAIVLQHLMASRITG